jgi:hypothetical protein
MVGLADKLRQDLVTVRQTGKMEIRTLGKGGIFIQQKIKLGGRYFFSRRISIKM